MLVHVLGACGTRLVSARGLAHGVICSTCEFQLSKLPLCCHAYKGLTKAVAIAASMFATVLTCTGEIRSFTLLGQNTRLKTCLPSNAHPQQQCF